MKSIHLQKRCAVIIKKPKVPIFDEYGAMVTYILDKGAVPDSAAWEAFREQLVAVERARLNVYNSKVLIENPALVDDDYFYVVAGGQVEVDEGISESSVRSLANSALSGIDISPLTQDRVIATSVEQTTESAWTATITLDNTDDLFNLHTYEHSRGELTFCEQDCVIESNDEVEVYLSDWEGRLHQVFTGYVNSVDTQDDGETKRVVLSCEDVTKKLSMTRTNANPSLDPVEAVGNTVSPYSPSWANSKADEVVMLILGRVYCDVLRDPYVLSSVQEELDMLRKSTTSVLSREQAFVALSEAMDSAIRDIYVEKKVGDDGYVGYKARTPSEILSGDGSVSSRRGDVAFYVTNLNQPIWSLEINTGGFDCLISDWKSNDVIISEIARRAFFEFFADEQGIIHFRPTNLTLPRTNAKSPTEKKLIEENYWIRESNDIYVKSFNKRCDDRQLFTDVIVNGMEEIGKITNQMNRKLVIGPYGYRRRFGVRMMSQEVAVGLNSPAAFEPYGQQLLWRQNATFYSSNMPLEGNSLLVAGNPLYIERWESVYYISRLTHSFVAGESYNTELELNYRRRPLCVLGESSGSSALKGILSRLVDSKSMSEEEKASVLSNEESLTWGTTSYQSKIISPGLLGGRFVWEPIPRYIYPSDLQICNSSLREWLLKIKEARLVYTQLKVSVTNSELIKEAKQELDSIYAEAKKEFPKVFSYTDGIWKVDEVVGAGGSSSVSAL